MIKRVLVPVVIASTLCVAVAARAQKAGDCGSADALVTAKIRTLMQRDDTRSRELASQTVPSLEQARALCAVPQVRAALRLYAQLLLDMEIQEASAAHALDGTKPITPPQPASNYDDRR